MLTFFTKNTTISSCRFAGLGASQARERQSVEISNLVTGAYSAGQHDITPLIGQPRIFTI